MKNVENTVPQKILIVNKVKDKKRVFQAGVCSGARERVDAAKAYADPKSHVRVMIDLKDRQKALVTITPPQSIALFLEVSSRGRGAAVALGGGDGVTVTAESGVVTRTSAFFFFCLFV